MRRRFATLSAAAFASIFGTAACGAEEQIQQRVEEEVQQGRTQIEGRVQDAQKQVDEQVQDVQKQVEEKPGEGQ